MIEPKATVAVLGWALVAGLAGCQSAPPRDGVFVHISRAGDNPHALLMGLKMATVMAEDRDVLVYFDLQGINAVLKDSPDVTHPAFDSSRRQLALLLANKVPVQACPGCLKAAGRQAEDLLPGVQVADKAAFFEFTKGRILTIDY